MATHTTTSVKTIDQQAEAPSRSFVFWRRWLLVVSALTALFGLDLVFINAIPPLANLMHANVDPVFFGAEPVSAATVSFQGFVYGIMGAVMFGWASLMFAVVYVPFQKREKWAYYALDFSVVSWYLIDTVMSISYGVTFNVILNTVFLALFMIPLVMTYKDFR